MNIRNFVNKLSKITGNFFTGVPDSLLQPFNTYLMKTYGVSDQHIIAANEGNAVALAAGYHLATGKTPVVYLQNSGLGNIVNPVTSLLNDKVYGIPCVFIIGWRGEPGVKDEPQHIFQGGITAQMLKVLDIEHYVVDQKTTDVEMDVKMSVFSKLLNEGKSVAFLIKKDAFHYNKMVTYQNDYKLSREEILRAVTDSAKDDIIVSTTGKTSRELFEIREASQQPHNHDFLTVGSMGNSSSIALGIALNKKDKRVWCLDGDGSLLMHMGAMAVIGDQSPANLVHVVINNEAHESVGGQPTVVGGVDLQKIAIGCRYNHAYSCADKEGLTKIITGLPQTGPVFIEVKAAIGSRKDLGRPTKTPIENKRDFMNFVME